MSVAEAASSPARKQQHADMLLIPGSTFRMGSDSHYPEEAPVHRVTVDAFWMDRTPVTNRQFREFVEATGYVSFAEIAPDPKDYPGALPHMLRAGSLVFSSPDHPVDLGNFANWWSFKFGANWRRPYGKGSSIRGLDDHPVVHIAYCDAEAYARWAGKQLPTEAEWEYAARSGLDQAEFAWGDAMMPAGRHMANTWQGQFPRENLLSDGYARTSPVDARGGLEAASYDPRQPQIRIPRKVIKGGSHLCAPNYCRRYRPAARHAQPVDTSTSHVGFRCITREENRP